ncbi:hypothetical protein AB8Q18_11435 [Neisseriaceae bacterium CLB008]
MQKFSSLSKVMTNAGVYIGAVIGAGYASGQEVLQFFVSYGYVGLLGAVVVMLFLAWYGTVFMELGHRLQTSSHKVVMNYLCGPKIGFIADYVLLFFMFGFVSIMISGGGAAMHQYYGWPPIVGKLLIAVATFATVYLGFSSALRALGVLSPIMIVGVILVSVITISKNYDQLAQVSTVIETVKPEKATSFWWLSAIIYVSYNVITGTSIFAAIGHKEKNVWIVRQGGIWGGIALGVCIIFISMALFSDLAQVAQYEIPFLELARQLSYTAGLLFSFILLIAVYTTAVSNLYGLAVRFYPSGTAGFKRIVSVTVVLALFASMVPFSQLVGVLYPILGVLGLFVMICALYKTFTGQVFGPAGAAAEPKPALTKGRTHKSRV